MAGSGAQLWGAVAVRGLLLLWQAAAALARLQVLSGQREGARRHSSAHQQVLAVLPGNGPSRSSRRRWCLEGW